MIKKKLPLCESPIKVYSNYAYILSVLLNNDDAKNWFYSNFIQVKYIRDTENKQLFIFNYSMGNLTKYFYNIPFLEVRSLSRNFLLKIYDDVILFLQKAIESGYYIMTVLDEYYLSPRPYYNKKHNMHLIMINGFDFGKKIFYSMGFNAGTYQEAVLGFDEVLMAISSKEGNNENVRDDICMLYRLQERNDIEYLQENFNYFPYELNLKLIKRSLQEYLESKRSDEHFSTFYEVPRNSEYGILYYVAMIEYIDKYMEGKYVGDIYEIAFYGMLEHKLVMIQRLKYLQYKNCVSNIEKALNMYEYLAEKAETIKNLIIKYNMTKKTNILSKVKIYLEDMYLLEKQAVKIIIKAIEVS